MLLSERNKLNAKLRKDCQYLTEHGVTLAYLAANAGIDKSRFSKFMRGTNLGEKSVLSLREVLRNDFKWKWVEEIN